MPTVVHGPFNTSGTDTAPSGTTSVTIQLWGAGGGGARDTAGNVGSSGGSGPYITQTVACTPGTVFTHTIVVGGLGRTGTDGPGAPALATTTCTGTVTSGTIALSCAAGPGGPILGTAPTAAVATSTGTATPAAVATIGNVYAGTVNSNGPGAPNGGGDQTTAGGVGTTPGGGGAAWQNTSAGNGGNGAPGQVTYTYTTSGGTTALMYYQSNRLIAI